MYAINETRLASKTNATKAAWPGTGAMTIGDYGC